MTPSNNFNLKWTKHQATLVSVFDSLLDKEKLTDCTISAEGQHIRAHKIILSACSPYFEELFTENNEKHPMIILHNVKYDSIKALVDFMYRGEVNVPQTKLRGVLDLSKSLQIRGLSDSRYADDVNTLKVSGINSPPTAPDNHWSQPASSSCITSGQYEPEEKGEPGKGSSPTVSALEGVASDSKSNQRSKKGVTGLGFGKRTGYNECQEVITLDCDSKNQLASQKQVWPTVCNLTDGPVFSPNHCQSVSNELQTTSAEMAVVENDQYIIPDPDLPDKTSTNLSTLQFEVSLEKESEDLKSDIEIIEDLTIDDCVNSMQNSSVRNSGPPSEAVPSQSASVPCCTIGGNGPEENGQLLTQSSPAVSPEEEGHMQVDSISKSMQNYRKSFNQCSSYQEKSQNAFDEIITSDSDSVQLPSGGLILPTSYNSSDGSFYSPLRELKPLVSCADSAIISSSCRPVAHQFECRELQSSSGEMTLTENEQFLMPEPVSTGSISSNVSSMQLEVMVETKNNIEIVEDLTLDNDEDGDYSRDGDYRDDNSGEVDNGEAMASNEGMVHPQDSNSLRSPFGGYYLTNKTIRKIKQFICNACGKSYSYSAGLGRHKMYMCGKEPSFHCPYCSYRSFRNDHLRNHILSKHNHK